MVRGKCTLFREARERVVRGIERDAHGVVAEGGGGCGANRCEPSGEREKGELFPQK